MDLKLRDVGNSQGIIFNKTLMALLHLKPGEVLDGEIVNGKLILSKK